MRTDTELRTITKMAFAQATETVAQLADQFANHPLVQNLSGSEALRAFASTIRAVNSKR